MKTFYNPKMYAQTESFSLSPLKPKFMAEWVKKNTINSITDFDPATREQLYLAHQVKYVDGVLDLTIANGFGNHDAGVATSLLYTVGSMIAAVRDAVTNNATAFSPTSGFHHAGWGHAADFCTFNGLIVALLVAKQEGLIQTATIIDGDMHWGDGTQEIIDHLGLDWITHWSGPRGKSWDYSKEFVKACFKAAETDLTIYQAGADIHVKDPLGGILSSLEMLKRDWHIRRIVANKKPFVWNLAGGYQYARKASSYEDQLKPVLELHQQTFLHFDDWED